MSHHEDARQRRIATMSAPPKNKKFYLYQGTAVSATYWHSWPSIIVVKHVYKPDNQVCFYKKNTF
jgi:hypothetical protein